MGISINPAGIFDLFDANGAIAHGQPQAHARFGSAQKRGSNSKLQGNAAPESQSATDDGLYQVPAGVALQAQLQSAAGASAPNLLKPTAEPALNSAAAAASGTGSQPAQTLANADAATSASGTSSTIESEENQLLATLQSLGLSPTTVQEFVNLGDLLAEVSPGLFQAFLNAMTSMAHTFGTASSPASTTPAGTGKSSSATPAVSTNAAAPTSNTGSTSNSLVEIATIQVSAGEIEFATASPGSGASASEGVAAAASVVETIQLVQPPTEAASAATTSHPSPSTANTTGSAAANNPHHDG